MPVLARRQSVAYRIRKYLDRHRWALATGVLVAVVLSTALGIVAWQARQAVAEASRAQAMQDFVIGLFEHAGSTPGNAPLDVRQLLEAGVQRGAQELSRQPAARAALFGVIARLRLGLGDYEQALALLNRQGAIIDALPAPPPGLRLEAVTDRGRAQRLLGRLGECIVTMQPWLALARREQQQLPTQVAEFYSQLGRCRRATGEPNSARLLFQGALALRRNPLDDEAGVIESLADLAALRADAGDPRAALQGFSGALAQMRQTVGNRHPLAIELQRNIAEQRRNLGQLAAAEAAYRSALQLAEELHGPSHPETLVLRRHLAAIFFKQGRYSEADTELGVVHAALLGLPGQQRQALAESWQARGLVAWQRGDLTGADAALKQAVALHRRGGDQAQLAGALSDHATVLHAAGRSRNALRALAEARRLRIAQLGAQHALVGDLERLTGEIHAASGSDAAAAEHLQQAVRLTTTGYGPRHPHTRLAVLSQARSWVRQGRVDDALARFATVATLQGRSADSAALRWRARAYAAEARCHSGAHERARIELDVVQAELRASLPEGGALAREVAAIQAACP
ncbi:MAG: tetratricopeptide repeat protein, partial [Gammaproteobacteria bacterium]|nr:tetratricopeptide repeat protein [Gammaproteobacteria bacterium]